MSTKLIGLPTIFFLLSILIVVEVNARDYKSTKKNYSDLSDSQKYIIKQQDKIINIWNLTVPEKYRSRNNSSVTVVVTIDQNGDLVKVVYEKLSKNPSLNIFVSNILFKHHEFDPPPLNPRKGTFSFGIIF